MILKNISQATLNKNKLISLILNFTHVTTLPLTLINFLHIYPHITLEDIYKVKVGKFGGWSALLNVAKGIGENAELSPEKITLYTAYYRAINNRLLNCTSLSYLRFIQSLIQAKFSLSSTKANTKHSELFALMAHYDFWDKPGKSLGFNDVKQSLLALNNNSLKNELSDVLSILVERLSISEFTMPTVNNVVVDNTPLNMHVRYPKEHILVAFGDSTFDKKSSSREGILNIANANIELMFVTLNKCEKQFSATTMYHDYAISPTLFHWQTQNSAKPATGRGLNYIKQKENNKTFLLFVREQAKDENGRTMGFVNFGPVDFVKYEGSQPMNITWKLKHPMPAYLWHETAKLAVG
jgi:hypothetical protein